MVVVGARHRRNGKPIGVVVNAQRPVAVGGELDGLKDLSAFADKLDKAVIDTIESGVMTGDLASISTLDNVKSVTSRVFIEEVRAKLA